MVLRPDVRQAVQNPAGFVQAFVQDPSSLSPNVAVNQMPGVVVLNGHATHRVDVVIYGDDFARLLAYFRGAVIIVESNQGVHLLENGVAPAGVTPAGVTRVWVIEQ